MHPSRTRGKRASHWNLAAAAGLALTTSQATAAPVNWSGAAGTDDWHTPANWLEDLAPIAGDDVLVGRLPAPSITSVLLSADASPQTLTIENGHSLTANSILAVTGLTTLGSSALAGAGTVILLGDTLVQGNAAVSVDTFDMDGDPAFNPAMPTVEIAAGGNLAISSPRFSTSGPAGDFTGRLFVSGALSVIGMSNWALSDSLAPTRVGTLELAGGTITGSHLTNRGLITGHGTIATLNVINNTSISASGGTLTISTLSFPDLDGFGPKGETGIVNAIDGDIRITTNQGTSHRFNGTLNIGPGRSFNMDFFGLNNSGVINLPAGARYVAPRFSQTPTGTLNITVNGAGPGETGLITASGIVTVGGTLNLTVAPTVTLQRGQGIRLITAQTVTGNFTTLNGVDQAQQGYFVYADNRAVGAGSLPLALAQPGDANFDGRVDSGDLLTVLPFFNNTPPGVNATWAQGDFEEDGDVDSRDILASSPFYNQGIYVQFIDSLGPAAAATPRPAAAPSAQPLKAIAPGDGAAVEYDATTGNLTLRRGEAELAFFVLRSASGSFDPDAAAFPSDGPFTSATEGELSQFFFAPWASAWDMGAVLPPGLPEDLLATDLAAVGGALGRPIFSLDLIYVPAVPEPPSLSALVVALLKLRRRRH